MNEKEALRARLDEIDEEIRKARDRLKLKKTFHADHVATADELLRRYELLRRQLDSEVADFEIHGKHINGFQKAVLSWLNQVTFDR